ncbi:hypothetical protein BGZ76_005109, partial [Entomortierella beljakovae]
MLEELASNKKISDATKTAKIILDMLQLVPDNEKRLKLIGNIPASNLLIKLAGTICDTIRNKNHGK